MELKVEDVKNIQSLTVCKKILRQSIVQNDKLNQELRHQKYKWCLAMAKCCDAEIGIADTDCDYEDMQWYQKWYERWLELAKNFNPNNSTAHQCKGKQNG